MILQVICVHVAGGINVSRDGAYGEELAAGETTDWHSFTQVADFVDVNK